MGGQVKKNCKLNNFIESMDYEFRETRLHI